MRNRKKANGLGDNRYSALKFMASGVRKIFRLRGYQLTCAISWEWKWWTFLDHVKIDGGISSSIWSFRRQVSKADTYSCIRNLGLANSNKNPASGRGGQVFNRERRRMQGKTRMNWMRRLPCLKIASFTYWSIQVILLPIQLFEKNPGLNIISNKDSYAILECQEQV